MFSVVLVRTPVASVHLLQNNYSTPICKIRRAGDAQSNGTGEWENHSSYQSKTAGGWMGMGGAGVRGCGPGRGEVAKGRMVLTRSTTASVWTGP